MFSLQLLQVQSVLLASRYNNYNKISISKYICNMQGMPRSLSNNKPLESTYGKGSTNIVNEDASSLDFVSPES